MAEFLTTTGISHRLEEIIQKAQDRLWLISPFLKVTPRIKQLLEETNRLKIDSRVIYGKNELQPEENNWLESMTSIRTSFCKDLHAKCYMNENEALLTSMNLYEYSQVNNYEMGILVSREKEPELYDAIYQASRRILRASQEIRVSVSRVVATEIDGEDSVATKTRRQPKPAVGIPTTGFCIRCRRDDLPAKPTHPYCGSCFWSWNRYKNKKHEEKHCHICGIEHKATLLKPLCWACFPRYKDVFTFVVS